MNAAAKSFQAARAVADGSGGGGTFTGGGSCLEQPAAANKVTARRAATTPRVRLFLRVMITSMRVIYSKTGETSGYSWINTSCALAVTSGSSAAAVTNWLFGEVPAHTASRPALRRPNAC